MTARAASLLGAFVATGALLAAAPAAAEINPGQQEGLGLTARDVPDLLKKAKTDPYAPTNCEAAYQEVAQLDQILGPDADEPDVKKDQAGNLLLKGARSLIPYREVFRVITGVDRKERELAEAAMAGWARRGYLKGFLRGDCSEAPTIAENATDNAQTASALAVAPPVEQAALTEAEPQVTADAAPPAHQLTPPPQTAERVAAVPASVNPWR